MHLTGALRRKERRKKSRRAAATRAADGQRRYADPAKAAVMTSVERLVRDGLALCSELDSGALELTLLTGEVFHLGRTSVTRII